MPINLSAIDLATLNAAQGVIVAALRNKCCQWEQDAADAAADGRLTVAAMKEDWACAADVLATTVGIEFSALFCQALAARLGNLSSTTQRTAADQVLDAMALDVAAAQDAPDLVAA